MSSKKDKGVEPFRELLFEDPFAWTTGLDRNPSAVCRGQVDLPPIDGIDFPPAHVLDAALKGLKGKG